MNKPGSKMELLTGQPVVPAPRSAYIFNFGGQVRSGVNCDIRRSIFPIFIPVHARGFLPMLKRNFGVARLPPVRSTADRRRQVCTQPYAVDLRRRIKADA